MITARAPECEALMAEIARARAMIQVRTNIAQEVKTRPSASSRLPAIAGPTIPPPRQNRLRSAKATCSPARRWAQSAARMPNVLAEDTWDLFRILLR